ncbi:hypothetical protein MNBD_UNCLBAC01-2088 [hydrothermal vent metagenome]|uniref:Pseudouridine synthase RsuA/RluA-like domain-containing protein n=1 Tax=hydrothermal vent metagenome TaxID=652676 RepID=A0A3B1DSE3_9ZZZZ
MDQLQKKIKVIKNKHLPKEIKILYEDKDILIVEKAAGFLTMGTEREKVKTAYYVLTNYVRKGQVKSRKRIFIVHRLDKETSGIMIFAKNYQAKEYLQKHWDMVNKKYLAVVHGILSNKEGRITSYLAENTEHVMYSTSDKNNGKLAHTDFKVLKEIKGFSLLEVSLITGRKNQIRAHFSEKGNPIAGDKKYGKKDSRFLKLALHSYIIEFNHPFNEKRMRFETNFPSRFKRMGIKI